MKLKLREYGWNNIKSLGSGRLLRTNLKFLER
jgi:hypothetical protein